MLLTNGQTNGPTNGLTGVGSRYDYASKSDNFDQWVAGLTRVTDGPGEQCSWNNAAFIHCKGA